MGYRDRQVGLMPLDDTAKNDEQSGAPATQPVIDPAVALAIVEEAPDGMLVVDDSGRIVLANRSIGELFGYGRDELVTQPIEVLVPEEARSAHTARRRTYEQAPARRPMGSGLQLTGRRRDGSSVPLEISLSPVATPSGRFTVAVVRDISGRLQAEAALRAAQEELALVEDRERIARDLHDTVLQRIFATGLSLQATALRTDAPGLRERLEAAVAELDTTIREIRTSIFSLQGAPAGRGLRSVVMTVSSEATRPLGFAPTVGFDGPVDAAGTDETTTAVAAVLREALSNVARHARAKRVDVDLAVTGHELVLRVADDGVGLDPDAADQGGWGLTNMGERARALGGKCRVAPGPGGGTLVEWRVPTQNPPGRSTDASGLPALLERRHVGRH
jgi:PAS domain S-box-containing protein